MDPNQAADLAIASDPVLDEVLKAVEANEVAMEETTNETVKATTTVAKITSIKTASLEERMESRAARFGEKDKLQQRAQRFGLAGKVIVKSGAKSAGKELLDKRAQRFGLNSTTSLKVGIKTDAEVLKKRAARFGVVSDEVKKLENESKLLERQKRFGEAK